MELDLLFKICDEDHPTENLMRVVIFNSFKHLLQFLCHSNKVIVVCCSDH